LIIGQVAGVGVALRLGLSSLHWS